MTSHVLAWLYALSKRWHTGIGTLHLGVLVLTSEFRCSSNFPSLKEEVLRTYKCNDGNLSLRRQHPAPTARAPAPLRLLISVLRLHSTVPFLSPTILIPKLLNFFISTENQCLPPQLSHPLISLRPPPSSVSSLT